MASLPTPQPKTPAEVAKAIAYIAATGLGILAGALSDNTLSIVEAITLGIAIVGAVPVYLLTGTRAKTISAAIVAGGQASLLLVADGTQWQEVTYGSWAGVALAALAAIGVAVIPNTSQYDATPVEVVSSVPTQTTINVVSPTLSESATTPLVDHQGELR